MYDGGLDYDHKKMGGYLGRRLVRPVTLTLADGSEQHLRPGDRLHPTRTLRDVADFETHPRPFQCIFWRVDDVKTARLLHHSPLMDIPGVGTQSYAIDILHTWHLGGLPRYIAMVFWIVLRSDALASDFQPWLKADDKMHLKLLRLRSSLWIHYKQMQAADPTWRTKASQVWNLTIKMLGKESNPNLRAKASETRHLLEFAVGLLEQHQGALDPIMARFMLASGRAAMEVNTIIRESDRLMDAGTQQRLLDAYIRHLEMYMRSGGNFVPKHHLFIHCIQRISYLDNPRFYACYHDESLNGVVVKIARSCHRLTFMHSVHEKFRWAGKLGMSHHMF